MKKIKYLLLSFLLLTGMGVQGQQLPDPHFEDWSDSFDGNAQPKYWHGSNVSQTALGINFKFTFLYKETGRTGSCAYVANKEVGAAGVKETAPGYFSLGNAWNKVEGIDTGSGTGGTEGGISFKYRPDTLSVWVKRTGSNAGAEDFNIVFYSWQGTSKGNSYRSKGGSCKGSNHTNEECDIRQTTNGNTCGTTVYAKQVAEGWHRERATYSGWTNLRIPIYYLRDDAPEMVNVIFSAGDAPNAFSSSGLKKDNGLYVDDVELIYACDIQKLYVGGVEWTGFNPRTEAEQVYSLPQGVTSIPEIYAMRGIGELTNTQNKTASFPGRRLTSDEMTIKKGKVGEVTTITVTSGDGQKTMTYRIKFMTQASSNANLQGIKINGKEYEGFNAYANEAEIVLDYGTTSVPEIVPIGADAGQTFEVVNAKTLTDATTIKVTAADGKTTRTYTFRFKVGQLSDNTLKDILINGVSLPDFTPDQVSYTVSLPLTTTTVPEVKAVSAYKDGDQTIVYEAPSQMVTNSQYKIKVSTPGNPMPKTYTLTFKLEASSNTSLKSITLDGKLIDGFDKSTLVYYVTLPMGTATIPAIGYEKSEAGQTVTVTESDVNGTTVITVKAENGSQGVYKINFTTPQSENTLLKAIYINGSLIDGFVFTKSMYTIALPVGSSNDNFPSITWETLDEFQKVELIKGNIPGVTRLVVTAGNGSTAQYQLVFSVAQDETNYLNMIYVDGKELSGFDKDILSYTYTVSPTATALPKVTYERGSNNQKVTEQKPSGLTGDYSLIVRPQKGQTRTYTITFTQNLSANANLKMLRIGGKDIEGFEPTKYNYTYTLPVGTSTLPEITYEAQEDGQKVTVIQQGNDYVITVIAQDGTSKNTYKVSFAIQQAENTLLEAIYLNGKLLDGFVSSTTVYYITLPIGSTDSDFPTITWKTSDEYQTVEMTQGGINGTTRLIVTAGNEATGQYQLIFSVAEDETNYLNMIYVDGKELPGFDKETLNYTYSLSPTATDLPKVTYDQGSEYQKVTEKKPADLTGDYTLTVRPQKGQTRTYTITFTQNLSANANLKMISLDGVALEGFSATKYTYAVTLPVGTSTLPDVTYEQQEEAQKVVAVRQGNDYIITVIAQDGTTKNTYKLSFTVQQAENTLLEGIYLNGQLVEGFAGTTTVYTISLPVGSTEADFPTITWKTTDEYQKVEMTVGGINGTTRIFVTAGNGATTQYQLIFSVAQDETNYLNMIYVDGKELPGFDKETLTYTYMLSSDVMELPAVTYEQGSAYQKVTENKPSGLTGNYTLTVRPQKGQTRTYTITFTQNLSSNALLKMIRLDGEEIDGFSADQFNYTFTLPVGTSVLPEVTYDKQEDAQKVVQVRQGNAYIITVIAQDGTTKNTYKVTFNILQSENTLLKAIYLNGTLVEGFVPATNVYYITLPIGTTESDFPAITWETTDEYQKVEMTKGGVNGTTRIFVTADDGATAQYQLIFSVLQDETNYFNMIYIDGKELPGFDKETLAYTYNIGAAATTLPVVTYDKGSAYQNVTERQPDGLTGDYVLTVRPQKGAVRTYTITFNQDLSANADLKMIRLDGVDMEGFSATQYTYSYTLPVGTTTLPKVTYEQQEDAQKVVAVQQGNDYILTVKAQDGKTVHTYRISFTILQSDNAFLNMIYLDGEPIEGFDKTVLHYTYTLTSATCPAITVDKGDEMQQVTIAAPYADGTAQIVVRPQTGNSNTYTITFVSTFVPSVLLKGINLDGVPMADFQPNQSAYTIPMTTDALPEVTAVTEEGQTVQILTKDNTVTLFVQSGNLTGRYDLTFTRTVSSDCTLKSILLDGVALGSFSPDVYSYTVTKEVGSAIPEVTYVKNEAHQTVHTGKTGDATVQLIVIAEDGSSTNTYTVLFDIPADSDTRLKNITLKGNVDFTFDEDTYYYSVFYEEGIALPEITVETRPGQTAMIAEVSNTEQHILVRAADGTSETYIISYISLRSNNVQLKDIQIDGVSIADFDPAVTHYTYTLPWRTEVVPSIQPIGMLPTQTITTERSSVNGTTVISVLAPDGTATGEYTVSFPVVKSDSTYLSGLSLPFNSDLQLEPAFQAEVTDYEVFLPYGFDTVPAMQYEKAIREQSVQQIIRGLNETSEIIVTAENGDQLTYKVKFTVKDPTEENLLTLLRIVETNDTLLGKVNEVFDKTRRNFTANLPFGSRSMTVEYKKSYGTQTVFIESGGILDVTRVTVQSNVAGVADEVYTIAPKVDPKDPAVLTDIKVNGISIDGFDPERFSYIVNVTGAPNITYTLNEGASISYVPSPKHWQATITYGTRVNTYHLWFYYVNDVVPNSEFTDWSPCSVLSSANKPTGWNTIADAVGRHTGFFSFTPDELVTESDGYVHLSTRYSTPGGGNIPGFITIGNVTGSWGIAGASTFAVSGGISFHNSPDVMKIRSSQTKVNESNQVQYILTGSKGVKTLEWKEESTYDWQERTYDLSEANNAVGDPSLLNILLNSYYQVSGSNGVVSTSSKADMYVDYLRFEYNHTLTGLTVNGLSASMSGNAFLVTLRDPEAIEIPQLTFTGEVADQAQTVTWEEEKNDGEYGIRKAAIRNFAENGTDYTDYTLEVRRPLATINTLADILIGSKLIEGFDPDKDDYTIRLTPSDVLPDVDAHTTSSRATLATTATDDKLILTVTPEYGETKTYTVHIQWAFDSNTTLKAITASKGTIVPDFDPAVRDYTLVADTMPDFFFVKGHTWQTITAANGTIAVKAEDGTEEAYHITLIPVEHITTAQLSDISLDNQPLAGFSPDKYEYHPAETPVTVLYHQTDNRDSLVFIQHETGMTFHLFGSPMEVKHTYQIIYPTDYSSESRIKDILVGNQSLDGFNPDVTDYTLATDEAVMLTVEKMEDVQKVDISENDGVYTITVTAEDGVSTTTYTLTVIPELSSESQLAMIYADGTAVEGFRSDSTYYIISLPTPAAKTAEPLLPVITYDRKQQQQQVEMQTASLGQSTFINVTAENGEKTTYELLIQAEPSHNAYLTGIVVNGTPVDRFASQRFYYSTQAPVSKCAIEWASEDNFQTVTLTDKEYADRTEYTLHVVAQDGVTMNDYQVDIFLKTVSGNTELSNILLNGVTMDKFETELNPGLTFDLSNTMYRINLPADMIALPQVATQLKEEGQTAVVTYAADQVLITVTAKDGISKRVYTLDFQRILSSDAEPDMIYINGDELQGFTPTTLNYSVTLPADVTALPNVLALTKATQTAVTTQANDKTMRATILVTAQDGTTTRLYTIDFTRTLSDNTDLKMLYLDGEELTYVQDDQTLTFSPAVHVYTITLPVGTELFPELTWEKDDKQQTVTKTVLTESEYRKSEQLTVTAANGSQSSYTVNFEIQLSDNTLLQSIIIDNRLLADFMAEQTEYFYPVSSANTDLPKVEYEAADKYQTVEMDIVEDVIAGTFGKKVVITVTAQNRQSRVYTIHFPLNLSSDVTLDMIYLDGEELPDFVPATFYYSVVLAEGVTRLPDVMPLSKSTQTVETTQATDKTMRATILVTAENGQTQTYTIDFTFTLSDNADLKMLYLDGEQLTYTQDDQTMTFAPDVHIYTITLPIGTKDFPDLTWDLGDMSQKAEKTVLSESATSKTEQVIVTAANGRQSSYTVNYSITLSDNALLDMIIVDNKPLSDFSAAQNEYFYTLPKGQTELPKVEYVAGDGYQVIHRDTVEDPIVGTIGEKVILTVTAQSGQSNVYTVHFSQNLSSDVTLDMIYLGGEEMEGFAPTTFYYSVVLEEGVSRLPDVMPLSKSTQTVETTQATDKTLRATIVVTAENGQTQTYTIDFTLTLNDNTELKMLFLDGDTLTYVRNNETLQFKPDVRIYTITLPIGTEHFPNLTWDLADKSQKVTTTVLTEAGNLKSEQVIVTAATGRQGIYTVNYEIQLSDNAVLQNILIDNRPLADFQADQTEYFYAVTADETELPKVEYEAGDKYQVIRQDTLQDQITGMQTLGEKVTISVAAQNGKTRVYTVHFVKNLSSDVTLNMIYLDGAELEGFDANIFFYSVVLGEGVTRLPDVLPSFKAGQNVQTTQPIAATMRSTILVTAEDGVTQTAYTIVFSFIVNDNVDLKMLYLDGERLTYEQGEQTLVFTPSVHSYTISLVAGTTAFPNLTWDKGDNSQTVTKTVLSETATRKSEQVIVTAQSGRQSVYTVNYEIRLSDNTQLESIIVDNRPLSDFAYDKTEYFYTVPSATSPLPKVEYETADKFQTVRLDTLDDQIKGMKLLGKKITITVTAQNQSSRIYTIHFPVALSGESQLDMIYVKGDSLDGFDKDVYNYSYNVPYSGSNQHEMPNVTVDKKLNTQNVTYTQKGDSIMVIHVMAENGIHAEDYTIRFFYGKSPNAQLADIRLNGESFGEFMPDLFSYEIHLFDDEPMPAVEWIPSDSEQQLNEHEETAEIDGKRYTTLSCEVIAPDEDTRLTYSILFAFVRNAMDTLPVSVRMDSLLVRELPVNRANGFDHDFSADTLVYQMTPYALDATESDFFTTADVRYVASDPRVQAAIEQNDQLHPQNGRLIERVIRVTLYSTVPGDTTNAHYDLVQRINLSHDSTVIAILLDDEPMPDFDPEVHYYQIPVKGRIPGVSVVTNDTAAQVSILPDGDKRIITCVSQYASIFNPTDNNTYTVEFIESPIDQTARVEQGDILIKYIPGSSQLAIACIRKNAQIAVYSADGHLLFYRELQAMDPRYAIVSKDANGNDYFNDVTDLSQCTIITLDPQTLYFYTIFEGNKRKVTSGKLLFVQ